MSGKKTKRARRRRAAQKEPQQIGSQILALQQDINELVKENYDEMTPDQVGTAALIYAARINCQLRKRSPNWWSRWMGSRGFSAAARHAFKEVAKELWQ
jgi:hypothetical protein